MIQGLENVLLKLGLTEGELKIRMLHHQIKINGEEPELIHDSLIVKDEYWELEKFIDNSYLFFSKLVWGRMIDKMGDRQHCFGADLVTQFTIFLSDYICISVNKDEHYVFEYP